MISENSIVGFSNWDGTVSPDEFRKGAHLFSEKWKTVCRTHQHDLPPWSWVCCKNPLFFTSHEVSGYLSMEKMCVLSSDKIDEQEADQTVEEPDCFESEDHADPALLVQQTSQEAHYYDFHIVYSSSYRIPVLYFRGYRSDGQPLMLDQIERDLPPSSIQALAESKWTFITQQEHPYLNRPYFTLHPCGTNELMRLLLSSTYLSEENVSLECYFVSWLSIVSQVVGLRIPLQLAAYSPEKQPYS